MKAAILTIGQEILIGQIVDTNSAWIASQLNSIGVDVQLMTSISDSGDIIIDTINHLLKKYDVVLTTGGLGPTSDDITKPALCKIFNSELVIHNETLNHIKNLFGSRGLPITELNIKQAEVPHNCKVLSNPLGTAPGLLFKSEDSILICMPGVPFEMKSIMENHVIPILQSKSSNSAIVHKTIHTFGLPESFLAEKLSIWEGNLPKSISLAYLPSPTSIRLRLSSFGSDKQLIEQNVNNQIEELKKVIPEYIFGFDNDTLSSVVGNLLRNLNAKLAVAESCTGGSIAQMITSVPGSSDYFSGGVVAYSNDIKTSILGVDKDLIAQHGAVSQQVVETMAKGVRVALKADYSIATSGIAGPSGGTPEKPVGTVWIAVSSAKTTESKMFRFSNDRERNIIRSAATALNMTRLQLLNDILKK